MLVLDILLDALAFMESKVLAKMLKHLGVHGIVIISKPKYFHKISIFPSSPVVNHLLDLRRSQMCGCKISPVQARICNKYWQ